MKIKNHHNKIQNIFTSYIFYLKCCLHPRMHCKSCPRRHLLKNCLPFITNWKMDHICKISIFIFTTFSPMWSRKGIIIDYRFHKLLWKSDYSPEDAFIIRWNILTKWPHHFLKPTRVEIFFLLTNIKENRIIFQSLEFAKCSFNIKILISPYNKCIIGILFKYSFTYKWYNLKINIGCFLESLIYILLHINYSIIIRNIVQRLKSSK